MLAVSAVCQTSGRTYVLHVPFPSDPYQLATFSSNAWSGSGPAAGIAAPGVSINSTYPPATYQQLSGTSMATPFVAAAAALVVAHCPSDSPTQIVSRLETTARDLGPTGPDELYGYGMLDADTAAQGC